MTAPRDGARVSQFNYMPLRFCIVLRLLPAKSAICFANFTSRHESNSPALCLPTSLDILRPLLFFNHFFRDLSLIFSWLADVENRPSFRQHKIAPASPTAQRARLNEPPTSPRSKLGADNILLRSHTVHLPEEPASRIIAKFSETTRASTASRLCALSQLLLLFLPDLHSRSSTMSSSQSVIMPPTMVAENLEDIMYAANQHQRKVYWSILGT
ncbi:hypothetical protein QR685DRAFT_575435 [Neurospora intermedia]|uniref:Uncharacterized protein n=1 Tax=Neurospora intermedia TaxID=5142 RepID=A0ABR3D3L8_NEUIN